MMARSEAGVSEIVAANEDAVTNAVARVGSHYVVVGSAGSNRETRARKSYFRGWGALSRLDTRVE